MSHVSHSRSSGAPAHGTRSLLAFLTCCLVLLSVPTCTAAAPSQPGRAEVKKTGEYKDVKADFLCRACVALSEVFLDEVLPATAQRYETYRDPATGRLRRRAGGGHREREQMIVETHEAIDGLCGTLAQRVEREAKAALAPGADPLDVQLHSPLATSPDLRDGVAVACPMALEEMGDELANLAFKVLLPEVKTSGTEDGTEGARRYTLPAGGAFCEELQLCSSYVHYHITSESAVRRRAREGRRAADAQAEAVEDASPRGSADTDASTTASSAHTRTARKVDGSKTTDSAKKNAAARKGGKARNTTAADTSRRTPHAAEEGETLLQTLQRAMQPDTWRELWGAVNRSEVASAAFWADSLRGMVDRDVLFHMQGYVPLGMLFLLALGSLLLLTVAAALLCGGSSRTSPSAVSAKPQAQASATAKKAQ